MVESAFDPYAALGVPSTATSQQIGAAHRRLAKRYHPDLHPGDETTERMRRINRAWHILSSPSRRARYDADRRWSSRPTYDDPYRHWAPPREAPHATWRPYPEPGPTTHRPARREAAEPSFGDNPWVTGVVTAVLVLLVFVGMYLGSLPH